MDSEENQPGTLSPHITYSASYLPFLASAVDFLPGSYGFDRGPDGNLVVNPEQAKLVRYIFSLFLQGMSFKGIARRLGTEGYITVTGKTVWHSSTIQQVLTNVKYKGDALLQKYYIADFLTKKPVVNKGEVPQYYVEKNHEAIIAPEVFDLVQKEIEYRSKHVETIKGTHLFSGRIRCGHCGGTYGPKVWHSNDRYRKVIWQCNEKYVDRYHKCASPTLTETELKDSFVRAVNKLIGNKDGIIRSFEAIKNSVFDSSDDEAKLRSLEAERLEIIGSMDRLTAENASMAMDQEIYQARHERLTDRYRDMEARISEVNHAIQDRLFRKTKTELFLKALKKQQDVVTGFSEDLWHTLADHAEVHGKDDVRFTFKNGVEIQV